MQALVVVIALTLAVSCSSKETKKQPEAQAKVPAQAPSAAAIRVDADTPSARLIEVLSTYESTRLDSVQAASRSCRLLAGRKDPGARETVIAAATAKLDDMNPGHAVRKSCARAMGTFAGAEVTAALLAIATDKNDRIAVRSGALDGLRQLAPIAELERIVVVMLEDAKLVDSARLVLAASGEPAVKPLLRALGGGWPEGVGKGTAAFAAARALGDLRAQAAVPALIASLGLAPMPAMVSRNGEAGMSHHIAVLEALRKIGGAEAAEALIKYARASKDSTLGTPAYDAYGFVAGSDEHANALLDVLADPSAAPHLRIGAGLAAARVAEKQATATRLNALTKGFAKGGATSKRLFLVSTGLVARAALGVECGGDAACFAKALREPGDVLSERLAALVPEVQSLSPGARRELAEAGRERALIGLAKLGAAARGQLPAILGAVASKHRLVHLAALDALMRVAERPCAPCVEALDEASTSLARDKQPNAAQMLVDTEAARLVLGRPR